MKRRRPDPEWQVEVSPAGTLEQAVEARQRVRKLLWRWFTEQQADLPAGYLDPAARNP